MYVNQVIFYNNVSAHEEHSLGKYNSIFSCAPCNKLISYTKAITVIARKLAKVTLSNLAVADPSNNLFHELIFHVYRIT